MKCLISSVTSACEVKTASNLMMKAASLEGEGGLIDPAVAAMPGSICFWLVRSSLMCSELGSSLEARRQYLKLTEEINTAYFPFFLYESIKLTIPKATRRNLCQYTLHQAEFLNQIEVNLHCRGSSGIFTQRQISLTSAELEYTKETHSSKRFVQALQKLKPRRKSQRGHGSSSLLWFLLFLKSTVIGLMPWHWSQTGVEEDGGIAVRILSVQNLHEYLKLNKTPFLRSRY